MKKWLKDTLLYRELIYNLTVKELKTRYKTAILGFLWALLNPLLMMVVLTVVFSFLFKIKVDRYPIFLLCALLPWFFFSVSLNTATTSIVDNANLIKKVFFPRQVIPLSIIFVNGFIFLLSLAVLVVFLVIFKVKITASIVLLPVIIFIQLLFVFGISLIASCLHTFFRDVKYIVEALLLCWFYATPIFYPTSLVPDKFHRLYMLNPMASLVSMYRDILLYGRLPSANQFLYVAFFACLLYLIGTCIFKKYEGIFADFI